MPEEFGEESSKNPEIDTPSRSTPISRLDMGLAVVTALVVLAALIYYDIAQGLAALVIFPGVPLVLVWFVYWFFLRRLIRVRRIRMAQERRLLREAAQRSTRS